MSSAATSVAHAEPSPTRMPTRMNGVEAGTTTRRKIPASPVPRTRAALIRVRSTSTTPWNVEMTQTRNAARKMTKIFGVSPMPISTMASGMMASGGMVRKNCTQGSTRPRTKPYHPMRNPTGIARAVPRAKPARTRPRLARTSFWSVPSERSVPACDTTSLGVGRVKPAAASPHHRAMPNPTDTPFSSRETPFRRGPVLARRGRDRPRRSHRPGSSGRSGH